MTRLELGPSLAVVPDGAPAAAGLTSVTELPLVVLVGVTGAGKSSTLRALRDLGATFTELPERRELTDAAVILPLAGRPVEDRERRFELTARYRETHPGGLAEALARLAVDPALVAGPLVFDGLRGTHEVAWAAERLPRARFAILDAPDIVRVRRLLGRNDPFDRVGANDSFDRAGANDPFDRAGASAAGPAPEVLRAIPGVNEVFSGADLEALAALPGVPIPDLAARVRIVASERRNYDPAAARALLLSRPDATDRVLDLDTAALPGPRAVAERIGAWL